MELWEDHSVLTNIRAIMTDIFQQRYYRINKFFLSVIGQWPYQSRGKRFFLLTSFILLTTSQIIPQIIAVIEFSDDPDIIIESIPLFGIDLAFTVKLTNIVLNSQKLKMMEILKRIEMDWIWIAQQPEIHMLRDYAEGGRQFTIAYSVGVYLTAALFMSQPVVQKIQELMKLINETQEKQFPFPVDYYGIDVDTYYSFMLLHMYTCAVINLIVVISADTMFIVQVQHACGMFTVVGHQLQRTASEIPEQCRGSSQSHMDPGFRHLAICIRKHNDVIKYSELLEACYNRAFFSIVGFNMLVMSVTGFKTVLMMDSNPKEAVRFAAFTVAQMVHLFFQSFFAQRLMDHSQQIHHYLCQAQWYKTSLATQKLLNLVTMRTHVPCRLTAGKIMVMSLQNFASILKTSISYLAVMRSML